MLIKALLLVCGQILASSVSFASDNYKCYCVGNKIKLHYYNYKGSIAVQTVGDDPLNSVAKIIELSHFMNGEISVRAPLQANIRNRAWIFLRVKRPQAMKADENFRAFIHLEDILFNIEEKIPVICRWKKIIELSK